MANRVQSAKNGWSSNPVTSIPLTFGSAPTNGSLILLTVISSNSTGITGISQTGVTWTLVEKVGATNGYEELWKGVVGLSAGVTATISYPTTGASVYIIAAEYAGTNTAVHVFGGTAGSSQGTPISASTGSTANTLQPLLWIATLGGIGSGSGPTWSGSPTNSFTVVDSYAVSGPFSIGLELLELFSTSTGTVSTSQTYTLAGGASAPRGIIAGFVDSSYIGPGNTYNETTNVIGVGFPGGSDTFQSSGPHTYNEWTNAVGVGVPGGSDILTSPGNTYNEVTNVIGVGVPGSKGGFSGGPYTYNELTSVILVGGSSSADRQWMSELYDGVIAVGFPSSIDTYVPKPPSTTYYEFTGVIAVGNCFGADTHKTTGATSIKGVGKPASLDVFTTVDSSTATGVGIPRSIDSRFYLDPSFATGIGKPLSRDTHKIREKTAISGVGKASSSDPQITHDRTKVTGVGRPAVIVSAWTGAEATVVKGIGKPVSINHLIAAEQTNAKGVGIPAQSSPLRLRENTKATGVGSASVATVRVLNEKTLAKGVGIPGGTSAVVTSDGSKAKGIGIPASAPQSAQASGIIPAIRYHGKATIPNLTKIVEGLPDEEVLQTLVEPFLVIVASKPAKIALAVQDQAYTVSIDIVYLTKVAAGSDNPPLLRAALRVLEQSLVLDYQLFGNTSIPSCFDLDIAATPLDRVNEYNKMFASKGQSVEIAVSNLTVSYVEFNQAQ